MIRVVIQKHSLLTEQLSLIIRVAEKEIERLTSEISRINDEREKLGIASKMGEL